MGIDILALAPYVFVVGFVVLMVGAGAALAYGAAVIAPSYFVWLCQLHLLKQNDRLCRRVVSFSENEEARKLVGYEAMADVSHSQVELVNRLEGMRARLPDEVDPYQTMAQ